MFSSETDLISHLCRPLRFGWHEHFKVCFLPTHLVFEQEPVQRLRPQVQGRLLREALHLLEPVARHDVRAAQQSRKPSGLDSRAGSPPVEVLSPGYGHQACDQDDASQNQPGQGLSDFRGLRLLHDGPSPQEADRPHLQAERERLCVRLDDDTALPVGLLVGQVPKAQRRCESPLPVRLGGCGAGVLPHHEGIGVRLQGDERHSLRVRLLLRVRPRLQLFHGTLQDSQDELLLCRESQEEPPIQVREMAATPEERAHGRRDCPGERAFLQEVS